jgi:SAM-dependent methyltransferase
MASSSHVEEVGELYEEFPYPAHGIISSVMPTMARRVAEEILGRIPHPRYLDAGCGTGEQTLGMKRAFPSLEAAGVDFSEASLAFARDLATRSNLTATFARRNLMEPLDDLGRFDLITSVGALQTLPDPTAALRHLRAIAAPGARLLGMVYGTYGKWDLFRVRDTLNAIAGPNTTRQERLRLLRDIAPSANSGLLHYLGTLRQRRRFGPGIALIEALRRVVQGRNPAYQADAFTCPHELTFTCKEIAEMLGRSGWEWQGWPEHSGMPDEPSQLLSGEALARVKKMSLLEQASIFERLVCPGNLFFIARPA